MSTRALRRAQRELEEKQLQQNLAQQEDQDEEESDDDVAPKQNAKPSLFAMLGDAGDDDEDTEPDVESQVDPSGGDDDGVQVEPAAAPKPSKKSKKKKKKAKAKGKAADTTNTSTPTKTASGLDEIDQALLALNVSAHAQAGTGSDQPTPAITEEMKQLYSVLSVDTQHLHAANEMKKLFGRAALQNTDDEPQPRQRGRGQQVGLAAAIAGRNAPGSRNLASLGLRRNIFIQGKEEWPRATSGGLGMEVVEKRADGSVEYRFVHNSTYQEVQREFQVCVGSMDPERMVQLLHFNRKSYFSGHCLIVLTH